MIKLPMENFFNATDTMINWTNCQGKCIEPVELAFKTMYPDNYLEYITDCKTLGTVSYNTLCKQPFRRLILNTYLYQFPHESITNERVDSVIKNIISVCIKEGITSLSIPYFPTNSFLTQQEVEDIIVNNFFTLAPSTFISLYS